MGGKTLNMKNDLYLDKESYLALLKKQKEYTIRRQKEIKKKEKEKEDLEQSYIQKIDEYKKHILELEKENNEFRSFKKGNIWKCITKWRRLKLKVQNIFRE